MNYELKRTMNYIPVLLFLAVTLTLHAEKKHGTELVFVEYNCENMFDCRHDSLKNDYEFLPEGERQWNFGRYWKKLNDIGRAIQQCGEPASHGRKESEPYHLPDLVAMCEVENDSVMCMLTRGAVLRGAGYRYVMTESPDIRGIDVALLYNPLTFRLAEHKSMRVPHIHGRRPTRDILYAKGTVRSSDTLHVFVVHAPSRSGGANETEPYRLNVAQILVNAVDSIKNVEKDAAIIIAGDFNDYSDDLSLHMLREAGTTEATLEAKGVNYKNTGVSGTYKYQGWWDSLDHIFISKRLEKRKRQCNILDYQWLLEEDATWGGYKPCRTFLGPYYHGGTSDHLPIVMYIEL